MQKQPIEVRPASAPATLHPEVLGWIMSVEDALARILGPHAQVPSEPRWQDWGDCCDCCDCTEHRS